MRPDARVLALAVPCAIPFPADAQDITVSGTNQSLPLKMWLIGAGLSLLLLGPAHGEQKGVLTITGTPISAEEESVKCQMKPPSWVSTRRLADCDSATYIEIPKTSTRLVRFEIWPATQQI